MLARVVGTQKWRRVAEEDRGDGAGSLSRVFTAAHPCQTAHGRFTNRPYRGAGGGARGSVPRVGEDSTLVRIFQEGWRNCGIGADWWGEMVQTWGRGGSCVGLDGSGPGNGWRARVTFFRVRGSEWVGFGGWGAARICVGASGGHWLSNMANARRWPQVQSWARGQAVGGETVLGAPSNLKQAQWLAWPSRNFCS